MVAFTFLISLVSSIPLPFTKMKEVHPAHIRFSKRWELLSEVPSTPAVPSITESKFLISINCQAKDQSKCSRLNSSINEAFQRISAAIYLEQPISINLTFESFCLSGKDCSPHLTLGEATPSLFYQFDPAYATKLGLDPKYAYPQALAKYDLF